MDEKKNKEESLIAINIESRISEKGLRNHPLTAEQKASNTEKSRIRSRDEIIFGAPKLTWVNTSFEQSEFCEPK